MNIRLTLLFLLASLVGFGCDDSTTTEQSTTNTYTLVFIDKSASTGKYDDLPKGKHIKVLNELPNNLTTKGDYISLYYIDAYTKDGLNKLDDNVVRFDTGISDEDGAQTAKRKQDEFNNKITELKQNIREQLKHHLNYPNDKARQNNTDLWDILHVINKESEDKLSNGKMEVLIFSDMVESITGDSRRDFHKDPIQSMEQAESFAKDDFEKIKEKLAITEIKNAGNIEVKMFFPNDNEGRAYVEKYWEALFQEFGIKVNNLQ